MFVTNRHKKLNFTIEDVYFCKDYREYPLSADVTTFYNSPIDGPNSIEYHTLFVDLTKTEEELLAGIRKSFRQLIRRTMDSEDVTFEYMQAAPELVEEFVEYYDSFAQQKGLEPIRRDVVQNTLYDKQVIIGRAFDKITDAVANMKVYFTDEDRCALIYDVSAFRDFATPEARNAYGAISKTFHYKSMLYFKQKGLTIYDQGGVALEKHEDRAGIDDYKMGFGGELRKEYILYAGKGLIGKQMAEMYRKKNQDY